MATCVGTTSPVAASFPNLHTFKTLNKNPEYLGESEHQQGLLIAADSLSIPIIEVPKSWPPPQQRRSKSGIKIVSNPTEAKLSDLGVRSWPKFRPLTLMENHQNPTTGNPYFIASRGGGGGGGRRRGLEIKDTEERSRGRGGRYGDGSGSSGKDKIDALGRLLTRILRHMASELKLDMRSDGYVKVQDLLKLNLKTFANIPLQSHDITDVREVVRRDNKQRFSLLEESGELLIRANQGHTIEIVETESLLKLIRSPEEIPVCVHGTYRRNLETILEQGLKRMKRLHVHFSCGLPTDGEVISGMRRDINMLIFLDVRKAMEEGMKLYISDNRVILTEGFGGVVPIKYFLKIESWPKREPIPF